MPLANVLEHVQEYIFQSHLKVNAKKSFFGKDELKYLGYWITHSGIQPVKKKVEVIKNIAPPKTKRELQ